MRLAEKVREVEKTLEKLQKTGWVVSVIEMRHEDGEAPELRLGLRYDPTDLATSIL